PTGRLSNQLATLDHIGLFDVPPPAMAPVFPAPNSNAPVEQRARAYLHANCSFCHRPQGNGGGPADLRFSTPPPGMGVCDAAPQNGDLGLPDAKLVVPGMPSSSIVSLRMHTLDVHRMPPLATRVVDTVGAQVVDDWITATTACP